MCAVCWAPLQKPLLQLTSLLLLLPLAQSRRFLAAEVNLELNRDDICGRSYRGKEPPWGPEPETLTVRA